MVKEKNGKKLVVLTCLIILVVTCVVCCTVLVLNSYSKLDLSKQYICELPHIVADREEELETRSAVFSEDVMARGELGKRIYKETRGLSETERLVQIRDEVFADSVTLVSKDGKILETTGCAIAQDAFKEQLETLESYTPVFGTYPISSEGVASEEEALPEKTDEVSVEEVASTESEGTASKDDEGVTSQEGEGVTLGEANETLLQEDASSLEEAETPDPSEEVVTVYGSEVYVGEAATVEEDGKAFVMFPVEGDTGDRLVFEFNCDPLIEVSKAANDWNSILARMLTGLEATAFIQVDGEEPIGYPLAGFTDEEKEQLTKEASEIFADAGRFMKLGGGCYVNIVEFDDELELALMLPYPEKNATALLMMDLVDFVSTGVLCAVTISLFIALSLVLYLGYVFMHCEQRSSGGDWGAYVDKLHRLTRSGRILMVVAILCFSAMLMTLEIRATIAYIGTTKGMGLCNEIIWHDDQTDVIKKTYNDIYLTRAQTLARFLDEHEGYRTSENLEEFCEILGADYLMIFDKDGNEVVASNSYTGFSVGGPDSNLSEDYKAVLLGYPSVVVGPTEDPISKKQQIGAAVLLTQGKNQADGFLLATFDADALNSELEIESLENTVNTFAIAKDCKAVVVNNEDGTFIAHTDANKIGQLAEDYISKDTIGTDYAGFTTYDGNSMYVAGITHEGKTLLYMVPEHTDDALEAISTLLILLVLAFIALFYCPRANVLCALLAEELKSDRNTNIDKKNPLLAFVYGYDFFFTILAVVGLWSAYTMTWPAFTFVFGGIWSRGVHLFSLWAALFLSSVTLSIGFVIRLLLDQAATKASARTRTMLKLMDSFVAYAVGIILVLGILFLFGVNTGALIASAGVVSIAIGMGSKDMVADVIAGLFLAVEDSIRMGDEVTISGWSGRVTNMGIRTTEITDDQQNVKIMNNSHISDVVNMSRQKVSCTLEIPIDYGMSAEEAESLMETIVEVATESMPELYGTLRVIKIYNVTEEGFVVRVSYVCAVVARETVAKRLQDLVLKQAKHEVEGDPEEEEQ